ncbi:hypothetical protein FAM09_16130 [Niastella caeni]|uniref:Uncharacterized protein n=1 Tax=Niastella caeni TaxID=2569763 RepID=A0A4V4H0X5_9BACT|nr:hypothetical protein [Niastella caeni]THU38206.1 hypothetical protein FAM09_16130 [Niastella caeni]
MINITSFETLDKAIRMAGGEPTVLEALWDGDTSGWYLYLNLHVIIKKLFSIKKEIRYLGTISLGGDIRLFNGSVPPWPEAELAKEWGKMANEKYGLIFYFPSDKEPDNDCPGWEQRHLAIQCADCAKMIIPSDSPYLPKEICYSCHLKREFNNKIKNAEPYDDGVNLYMVKDEEYNHLGYSSFLDGFSIAPFIDDTVQARREKRLVDIVTIDKLDISIIKEKIEQALDEKVAVYKSAEFPPDFPEKFKSNMKRHTVEYKGNKYELLNRLNEDHSKIDRLVRALEMVDKAISGNYCFKIYFKNGFTYRDDAVLRFVNFVSNGSTSMAAIVQQYSGIITETEVKDTVTKMEKAGCLKIEEEIVHTTDITRKLL